MATYRDDEPRDRFGPAEPENPAEPDNREDPRIERGVPISGRTARQGSPGRPILYVLVAALILSAIYLVATQVWTASEPTPPAGMIEETPGPAATPEPVNPAPPAQ